MRMLFDSITFASAARGVQNIDVHDTHDREEHFPEKVTIRLYKKEYSLFTDFVNYDNVHPLTNADLLSHGRVYVAVIRTRIVLTTKIKLDYAYINSNERVFENLTKPSWEFRRHTHGK